MALVGMAIATSAALSDKTRVAVASEREATLAIERGPLGPETDAGFADTDLRGGGGPI